MKEAKFIAMDSDKKLLCLEFWYVFPILPIIPISEASSCNAVQGGVQGGVEGGVHHILGQFRSFTRAITKWWIQKAEVVSDHAVSPSYRKNIEAPNEAGLQDSNSGSNQSHID